MKRKTHPILFKTVAEAMVALGYTDQKAAELSKCDRTWITRIRNGKKLKALNTPMRIARTLMVPIEALADLDAA
jgi:transcriptional regulator with XRE-family HTH domain